MAHVIRPASTNGSSRETSGAVQRPLPPIWPATHLTIRWAFRRPGPPWSSTARVQSLSEPHKHRDLRHGKTNTLGERGCFMFRSSTMMFLLAIALTSAKAQNLPSRPGPPDSADARCAHARLCYGERAAGRRKCSRNSGWQLHARSHLQTGAGVDVARRRAAGARDSVWRPPASRPPRCDAHPSAHGRVSGWGNYFRTGNADPKFNQLDTYVSARLTRWMARRAGQRKGRTEKWSR